MFDAIIETSAHDAFQFIPPPYEYETRLMPFDILSGDSVMRQTLCKRLPLKDEKERWLSEIEVFLAEFSQMSVYPE